MIDSVSASRRCCAIWAQISICPTIKEIPRYISEWMITLISVGILTD